MRAPKHGSLRRFKAGCRCATCRAAVPHGLGGYTNWGCRCEVCGPANTCRHRRARARQREGMPVRGRAYMVLDRHVDTVTAAIRAGATARALAEHYGIGRRYVHRWALRRRVAFTARPGSACPRWRTAGPLDLRDVRDLGDWILAFELSERELERWESEGGPAVEVTSRVRPA